MDLHSESGDGKMTPEAIEILRASLRDQYEGASPDFRKLLLEVHGLELASDGTNFANQVIAAFYGA